MEALNKKKKSQSQKGEKKTAKSKQAIEEVKGAIEDHFKRKTGKEETPVFTEEVEENQSGNPEAVALAKAIKEEENYIQREEEGAGGKHKLRFSSNTSEAHWAMMREESSLAGPTNTKIEEEHADQQSHEPRVKLEPDSIELATNELDSSVDALQIGSKTTKRRKNDDKKKLNEAPEIEPIREPTLEETKSVFTWKVAKSIIKIDMELEKFALHKTALDALYEAGSEYFGWLLQKSLTNMKSLKRKKPILPHLIAAISEDPRSSFLIDPLTFDLSQKDPKKSKPAAPTTDISKTAKNPEHILNLAPSSHEQSLAGFNSGQDSAIEVASSTAVIDKSPLSKKSPVQRKEILPEASSSSYGRVGRVKEEISPSKRQSSKGREVPRASSKVEAD